MNIPYAKVTVYALTFLGYIYCGYGWGLLPNLRNSVLSAQSIFCDVVDNFINVAKTFHIMNDVFNAAVEEDCIFKCPNGAQPRPNRNHIPSADGCGSLGLKINSDFLPLGEMKKCCNDHDICYDTCLKDKETCDVDFKRCLYKYCESYEKSVAGVNMIKACKGASKMLFTGTLTFGCKSYLDSQSKACYCPPQKNKDYKKNKYATGGERNDGL